MARPASEIRDRATAPAGGDDVPLEEVALDPEVIAQRYRLERARRRARERHAQERGLARVRFWAVIGVLVALAVSLLVLIWDQVQRLFGL